mmetsp:Transcript_15625/g.43700  ORF Transcript_15625/g.43700 Transcript_15625/m.43700 type:complete len:952 (-) Transcript_15625:452-3307(-)
MSSPATHFFYFPDQNASTPPEHSGWALPTTQEGNEADGNRPHQPIAGGIFSREPSRTHPTDGSFARQPSWARRTSFDVRNSQPGTSGLTAALLSNQPSVDSASSPPPSVRSSHHQDASAWDEEAPDQDEDEDETLEEGGDPEKQAACDTKGVVFGAVNTIVSLPSMVAFANIIFKSPKFAPWMPIIVRFLFLAAGVHQFAFVLRSKVPGAIGQVQDVGLIFLSAMTSSIVLYGEENDLPFEETLSTALLTITVSTTIVGVLIVMIAKFRVASLVQYVPVPVVGGYLAYVGYFCCFAGVSLAANQPMETLADWAKVMNLTSLIRILPMLGTWLALHLTVHNVTHPLGLPATICAIPLLFYIVLYASGHTLEDAQAAGWAPSPVPGGPAPFWEAWDMFHLEHFPGNIHWPAVFHQIPNLLALFFVVSFGSCMDIAAIQAECPFELDFDRELELIGVSNGLCGIFGCGFTGSYIFSQTLFNFRWGAWGRAIGVVVSASEILLFLAPVSVTECIPNFFFGGLMFWFGVDIAYDWLATAYGKVRVVEYALIWISFAAVMWLGLEAGIGLGCVLATIQFTWEYARLSGSSITVVPCLSSMMRTYDQRSALEMLQGSVVTVSLKGYIFFGSSLRLCNEMNQLGESMAKQKGHAAHQSDKSGGYTLQQSKAVAEVMQTGPSYLILDFRRVDGFDASSAQAFCGLRRKLAALGVQLVVCEIPEKAGYIYKLLESNGVIQQGEDGKWEEGTVFPTLDSGVAYCEEQILQVAMQTGLCHPQLPEMSLKQVLEAHLNVPAAILPANMDFGQAASKILPFLQTKELATVGECLFSPGELCNDLYILQTGEIRCEIDFNQWAGTVPREHLAPVLGKQQSSAVQMIVYGPGGILGDTDFFLQQPYSFKAVCSKAPCRCWSISYTTLKTMLKKAPGMLVIIQAMILRSQCMTAKHSMASLELLAAST